jgi:hypothetical protein
MTLFVMLPAFGVAQSRSVWIADYSAQEIRAAAAAGKNTLIYCGGGFVPDRSNGGGKHLDVTRYIAQRVAEELTNALVLPLNPYTPASAKMTPPLGLSDETYSRVVRELLTTATAAGAFKHVIILGDPAAQGGDPALENIARTLDRDWTSKGIRVYFVNLHELRPGQGGLTYNEDYLRRWAGRTISADRRRAIIEAAELLFVDRDTQGNQLAVLPATDRKIVTIELGKRLIETRVSSVLDQIRRMSPSHVR